MARRFAAAELPVNLKRGGAENAEEAAQARVLVVDEVMSPWSTGTAGLCNLVHYGKRLGVGSEVPFKLGIINSEFDFDATVPMVSANRGA